MLSDEGKEAEEAEQHAKDIGVDVNGSVLSLSHSPLSVCLSLSLSASLSHSETHKCSSVFFRQLEELIKKRQVVRAAAGSSFLDSLEAKYSKGGAGAGAQKVRVWWFCVGCGRLFLARFSFSLF